MAYGDIGILTRVGKRKRRRAPLAGGNGVLDVVADSRRPRPPAKSALGRTEQHIESLYKSHGVDYAEPSQPSALDVRQSTLPIYPPNYARKAEASERAHLRRMGELSAIRQQGTAALRAETARIGGETDRMKRAEYREYSQSQQRLISAGIPRQEVESWAEAPPGYAQWLETDEGESSLPLAEILRRRQRPRPLQAGEIIESMISGEARARGRELTGPEKAEITTRVMRHRPAAREQRRADVTGEKQWISGGTRAGDIGQILLPTSRQEDAARLGAAQKQLEAELGSVEAALDRAKTSGASDETLTSFITRAESIRGSLSRVRWQLGQYEAERIIGPEGELQAGIKPLGAGPPTPPRASLGQVTDLQGRLARIKQDMDATGLRSLFGEIAGLSATQRRKIFGKDELPKIEAYRHKYPQQWADRYLGGKKASVGAISVPHARKSYEAAFTTFWGDPKAFTEGIIKNLGKHEETGLPNYDTGKLDPNDAWAAWDEHAIRFQGIGVSREAAARGFLTALRSKSKRHYATLMNWPGPDRDHPFLKLHNKYMQKEIPSGPPIAGPPAPTGTRPPTAAPTAGLPGGVLVPEWKQGEFPGIEGMPAATAPEPAGAPFGVPGRENPYNVAERAIRGGGIPSREVYDMLTEDQKNALARLRKELSPAPPRRLLGPSGPLVY